MEIGPPTGISLRKKQKIKFGLQSRFCFFRLRGSSLKKEWQKDPLTKCFHVLLKWECHFCFPTMKKGIVERYIDMEKFTDHVGFVFVLLK